MKNYLLLLFALVYTSAIMAQAPALINYQAVVRDNAGLPLANNTPVSLRFSIHEGTMSGAVVYTETQSKNTNQFGLVTALIGEVTAISGVNWSGTDNFLQVEVSISGGAYGNMGTSQLVSVPYALSAGNSYWSTTGNDIGNTNSGNVGIGVATPTEKLEVNGQVKITGGSPGAGKVLTSDAAGVASWETPGDNVAFSAHASTSQSLPASATTPIDFGSEEYDDGNNFAANTFTAPSDGLYQFNAHVRFGAASSEGLYTWIGFYKNGSLYQEVTNLTNDDTFGEHISTSMKLASGDAITVKVFTSVALTVVSSSVNTWFNGYKIR